MKNKHPKLVASYFIKQVLEKAVFINELLNDQLDLFPYKQRSFITELVYGTVRNLIHIDFWIKQAFVKDLSKIEPELLRIIRISVYQILYMSNRKVWFVTNEATELLKKMGKKRSAGFVNYMLREILRQEPSKEKLKELIKDEDLFLRTYYSMPKWLFDRIKNHPIIDTSKKLEQYLQIANSPLGITLRVEDSEERIDEIINQLNKKGANAEKAKSSPNAIYTERAVSYNLIKDMENVFIQDESSQMVVDAMDVKKGEEILDLCAAPGGKTFYLSYLTGETGKVVSSDVNIYKLQQVLDLALKYKKKNIEIKLQDATILRKDWVDRFPKVLLDAPCSAIGTIRRHPEVKWLKKDSDAKKMARLSAKILKNASKYVQKDGLLLFAVCTLTREETVEQTEKFLKNNPNFKLEEQYYTINPKENQQRDFFFIAKFRRIK